MKKIIIILFILSVFKTVKSQNEEKFGLFNNSNDSMYIEAMLFAVKTVMLSDTCSDKTLENKGVYRILFSRIDENSSDLKFYITKLYCKKSFSIKYYSHYVKFNDNYIMIITKEKREYLTNVLKLPETDESIFKSIDKYLLDLNEDFDSKYMKIYSVEVSPTTFLIYPLL